VACIARKSGPPSRAPVQKTEETRPEPPPRKAKSPRSDPSRRRQSKNSRFFAVSSCAPRPPLTLGFAEKFKGERGFGGRTARSPHSSASATRSLACSGRRQAWLPSLKRGSPASRALARRRRSAAGPPAPCPHLCPKARAEDFAGERTPRPSACRHAARGAPLSPCATGSGVADAVAGAAPPPVLPGHRGVGTMPRPWHLPQRRDREGAEPAGQASRRQVAARQAGAPARAAQPPA